MLLNFFLNELLLDFQIFLQSGLALSDFQLIILFVVSKFVLSNYIKFYGYNLKFLKTEKY